MKYSRGHLQQMAMTVLRAKKKKDSRYDLLVMSLVLRTALPGNAVEARIKQLARG